MIAWTRASAPNVADLCQLSSQRCQKCSLKHPKQAKDRNSRRVREAPSDEEQTTKTRRKTEDEIGGYHLPAHATFYISPYTMHLHPGFWEHPETFYPERFTPEHSADRPRYAYLPFGGGPRQCIGSTFALTEAHLILAMLAQHYQLQLAPGHPVEVEGLITLRPRQGMKMIAQRR